MSPKQHGKDATMSSDNIGGRSLKASPEKIADVPRNANEFRVLLKAADRSRKGIAADCFCLDISFDLHQNA